MNLVLLQLLSLLCVAYASKRELTVDERFRCMEEVSEVERLRVHYAVAVTVHGFPLAVYSSGGGQEDYVSHSLLSTGHWGGSVAHDALELAKLVAAGMTPQQRACVSPPCHPYAAVDIGANVGWWTFTAAHAGFQTLSIEGAPPNVALLRLSLCLNPDLAPRITLYPKMLGSEGGVCAMTMPAANIGDGTVHCELRGRRVQWTQDEMRELRDASSAAAGGVAGNRIERVFRMQVSRLDDVLDAAYAADARLPHAAAFMRMDIEGSEYSTLNSTARWLQQGRLPVISSEIWSNIRGGAAGYLETLFGHGYKLRKGSCLSPVEIAPGKGAADFVASLPKVSEIVCSMLEKQYNFLIFRSVMTFLNFVLFLQTFLTFATVRASSCRRAQLGTTTLKREMGEVGLLFVR